MTIKRPLSVFFQINLQANRPLPQLVRIRAYVGGSLCGLLLNRGRQYVISGRSWLLVLFLSTTYKMKKNKTIKIFHNLICETSYWSNYYLRTSKYTFLLICKMSLSTLCYSCFTLQFFLQDLLIMITVLWGQTIVYTPDFWPKFLFVRGWIYTATTNAGKVLWILLFWIKISRGNWDKRKLSIKIGKVLF